MMHAITSIVTTPVHTDSCYGTASYLSALKCEVAQFFENLTVTLTTTFTS